MVMDCGYGKLFTKKIPSTADTKTLLSLFLIKKACSAHAGYMPSALFLFFSHTRCKQNKQTIKKRKTRGYRRKIAWENVDVFSYLNFLSINLHTDG